MHHIYKTNTQYSNIMDETSTKMVI